MDTKKPTEETAEQELSEALDEAFTKLTTPEDPVCVVCTKCETESRFKVEFAGDTLPKGWEEQEGGTFCGECKYNT